MRRCYYGDWQGLLLGARVALADGALCDTNPRAHARAALGPPEVHVCPLGSEGCLGFATAVTVRVRPLPDRIEYESVPLPDYGAGEGPKTPSRAG